MSRITESLLTGRSRAAFRTAISNLAVIRRFSKEYAVAEFWLILVSLL